MSSDTNVASLLCANVSLCNESGVLIHLGFSQFSQIDLIKCTNVTVCQIMHTFIWFLTLNTVQLLTIVCNIT